MVSSQDRCDQLYLEIITIHEQTSGWKQKTPYRSFKFTEHYILFMIVCVSESQKVEYKMFRTLMGKFSLLWDN